MQSLEAMLLELLPQPSVLLHPLELLLPVLLLEHLLLATALLHPLLLPVLLLDALALRALLLQQLLAPAPALRAGSWWNRWTTIRSRTSQLRWQLPVLALRVDQRYVQRWLRSGALHAAMRPPGPWRGS